jgi:hypothetical protein
MNIPRLRPKMPANSFRRSGNSALNLQQFSDFNFAWTTNFAPGSYNLIQVGSVSGNLGANRSGTIDGYPATLALQNNGLVLTVVPEPSTTVLLGVGVLGLLVYAWRGRDENRAARRVVRDL